MTNMVLNLEEVNFHVPYRPLEPGEYNCVVLDTVIDKSKNGSEMIVFDIKPLVEGDTFKDRKLKEYVILDNEIGLSKLKSFLGACGVTDFSNIDLVKICNNKELVGSNFIANITIREYTNKHNQVVVGNSINSIVM